MNKCSETCDEFINRTQNFFEKRYAVHVDAGSQFSKKANLFLTNAFLSKPITHWKMMDIYHCQKCHGESIFTRDEKPECLNCFKNDLK